MNAPANIHLKRAIAAILTEAIPELHAFADDLANRAKRYPEVVILELDSGRRPYGCGGDAHVVRDGDGNLTARGRLIERSSDFRLTLSAPGDANHSGAEIVQALACRIEDMVDALAHNRPHRQVLDPATGEDQRVTAIRVLSSNDLPPDFGGEPFLYRKAVTIRVFTQVAHERAVTQKIEHIDVTNGGVRD